jgi:hypothetical protein
MDNGRLTSHGVFNERKAIIADSRQTVPTEWLVPTPLMTMA